MYDHDFNFLNDHTFFFFSGEFQLASRFAVFGENAVWVSGCRIVRTSKTTLNYVQYVFVGTASPPPADATTTPRVPATKTWPMTYDDRGNRSPRKTCRTTVGDSSKSSPRYVFFFCFYAPIDAGKNLPSAERYLPMDNVRVKLCLTVRYRGEDCGLRKMSVGFVRCVVVGRSVRLCRTIRRTPSESYAIVDN